VKVAKKIVKDMEKWAKQLNQKKDYVPTPVAQNVQPQSSQAKLNDTTLSIVKQISSECSVDKKDCNIDLQSMGIEKVLPNYDSDSDETNMVSSRISEKDYVDFEKLTCNLCKRIFSSSEILSKHLKMSNLHKENLQKYKLQYGLSESSSPEYVFFLISLYSYFESIV
jgi:RNA-binding protein 5/10